MAKVKIDSNEYEFPTLDSLTLDEAVLMERHAGVTLDKIVPGESIPLGAVKALIIIAIRRARPDVTEREAADRVGSLKVSEFPEHFDQGDPDANPPPPQSSEDSNGSTTPSTSNGADVGVHYPEPSTPPATGQPSSDIGRDSAPVTSAA